MTAVPRRRVIVALDTQLAVGTATGAGVYERDLAIALRAHGVDVRELRAPRLDPWRFDRRVLWDQVLLPLQAARSGAALLHAASGTLPFVRTLPTVVTVHDLAWLRVQGHTRAYARAYFGALQSRAYRTAAAIVCDSEFTAREYRELVDPAARLDVVHPGVDPRFATIARTPDDAPFALVTGTVEARKNLLVLIEALPAIPRLRIVSAGPFTPYADLVRARAAELHVADRVDLRGYVMRAELDDLYARAVLRAHPVALRRFRLRPRRGALCRPPRDRGEHIIAGRSRGRCRAAHRSGRRMPPGPARSPPSSPIATPHGSEPARCGRRGRTLCLADRRGSDDRDLRARRKPSVNRRPRRSRRDPAVVLREPEPQRIRRPALRHRDDLDPPERPRVDPSPARS